MTSLSLISITVPPAMEETLVDWLLQSATHTGFSSYPVNGHSSREEGLTLAEQVAGRKKQIRFQMHIAQTDVPVFLENLKRDFAGAGLHYWVLPLADAGHV